MRCVDAWHAWETVFLALTIQATPYLVLGVLVSTALDLFVPHRALARVLPRRAFASVPVAAVAGAALPGCECSSARWMYRLAPKRSAYSRASATSSL